MSSSKLTSWGRYPAHPQMAHTCDWRSELGDQLKQLADNHGTTLSYGNGRSYGDSCLAASDQVVHTHKLDRFIAVDWQTGIITAEAGMTLEQVLNLSIPRGWFLPVTPGTKFVTLGGAVANDVHGKNHHVRGTFGCHVKRFGLIRSDQPEIICSNEQNRELFAATIGGLGLTGIIPWVELQLIPIKSSQLDLTTIRFNSLSEFISLADELDQDHEYSVAWIDCLAKGNSLGRGVFTVSDHAETGTLTVQEKKKLTIPITPPLSMINNLSLRLFNNVFYRKHLRGRQISRIDYDSFFYPLDSVLYWNRLYGKKGFQQYQCVIPDHNAESAIHEMLTIIATYGSGSFLAVLKRCGNIASEGLLSFPMPGISLALDFPQQASLDTLFFRLDSIVREAGGRLYPAKDAHMKGADFRHFYPKWQQVEALRDPALCSKFWKRVIAF